MRLTTATLLEGVADALREQIAPQLTDSFAGDAARIAQALILIAARAGDDAAAIRVEENSRMRRLFASADGVVTDEALASRLRAAAQSADTSLKIGALDAETGRLRKLLVELHCWLEGQLQPAARALDQEIWRALRDFELARAPRA